ncbi:DUF882 domain-containing protein [Rhizobium rhizoryzae]|uniref:DUF882 domain-containing protein n=1 Tax=Rhizobium rhizoryzae TaxID=451876 RepID=UPI0035E3E213
MSGRGRALMAGGLLALLGSATHASAEDRTLKLYFGHTGERAVITFKRNGVFDQAGLNQLNQFLRDWRAEKSTKMDPRLFDIVWEVYRRSGASDYINVVSGYRSPNTNAMLRTRSSGVAKESQHTHGKAMDFFIPGVKLASLRALAMQVQGGGVGYYPASGSPFVHVDVGGVRAWPRMSRQELVQLFPNGKTLHVPSDGKPLPGYETAVAEYKRRGAGSAVEIASFGGAKRKGNFFTALFGGGDTEEEEDVAESTASTRNKPAAQPTKSEQQPVVMASAEPAAKFTAPVPVARPGNGTLLTALRPTTPTEHEAFVAVTSAASGKVEQTAPFEDLSGYAIPIPVFASRPVQAEKVITASTAKMSDTVQASAGSIPLPSKELAAALVTPTESQRIAKSSFSASYTTGYPSQDGFKPVTATATFDLGRFGDLPARQ